MEWKKDNDKGITDKKAENTNQYNSRKEII